MNHTITLAVLSAILLPTAALAQQPSAYFEKYCVECHDATAKRGGLDLTALKLDLANPDNFARWQKVHDRIEAGEMPPRKQKRPPADETAAALNTLHIQLVKAD